MYKSNRLRGLSGGVRGAGRKVSHFLKGSAPGPAAIPGQHRIALLHIFNLQFVQAPVLRFPVLRGEEPLKEDEEFPDDSTDLFVFKII